MIRPDFMKWQQTAEDIRRLSVEESHVRTRERFQALYILGTGEKNATEWAAEIGRQAQTVHNWVHKYNASGPERLCYRRTGGMPPLFRKQNRNKSF
jgi:transposase